jgi:hypothetical protein
MIVASTLVPERSRSATIRSFTEQAISSRRGPVMKVHFYEEQHIRVGRLEVQTLAMTTAVRVVEKISRFYTFEIWTTLSPLFYYRQVIRNSSVQPYGKHLQVVKVQVGPESVGMCSGLYVLSHPLCRSFVRRSAVFRSVVIAITLCVAAHVPGVAFAQEIGRVVALSGGAQVVIGRSRVVLAEGVAVRVGDRIETDSTGRVGLLFRDDTRIAVGPNSQLTVDAVLMQNDGTARRFAVSATTGAFRFISGRSGTSAYEISTPTATLGIRGTTFDVAVRGREGTDLALFRGRVLMCGRGGRCADVSGACAVAVQDADGRFRAPENRRERNTVLNRSFPLVVSRQSDLSRPFRAPVWSCGNTSLPALQAIPQIQGATSPQRAPETPAPAPAPAPAPSPAPSPTPSPAPSPSPSPTPAPTPTPGENTGSYPGQSGQNGSGGRNEGRGSETAQGQDGSGNKVSQAARNR